MSGAGSAMVFRLNNGSDWQMFLTCILPIRPRPTIPTLIFVFFIRNFLYTLSTDNIRVVII